MKNVTFLTETYSFFLLTRGMEKGGWPASFLTQVWTEGELRCWVHFIWISSTLNHLVSQEVSLLVSVGETVNVFTACLSVDQSSHQDSVIQPTRQRQPVSYWAS